MIEYHKILSLENIVYFCEIDKIRKTEVFKDIPKYEGMYQVSDLGRIKSLSRKILRHGQHPFTSKEIILRSSYNTAGYLSFMFHKNGKSSRKMTHQIVAQVFLGHVPCGKKLVVNHKNFIKSDNRTGNLEIVTTRTNSNQLHLPSSSKYVGVSWCNQTNKFKAGLKVKSKTIHLGYFEEEEEASQYYQNAVLALEKGEEIVVKRKQHSSKYRGVSFRKDIQKWSAFYIIDKKQFHIGMFETELEATEAVESKYNSL